MDFMALDVETANADMASICQIGLATYENGKVVDEWKTLVDPQDYFDGYNTAIHGIAEEDVSGAPTFDEAGADLAARTAGAVVVTHTHFDRVAIGQASDKCGVPALACRWLDSARVVKRTWEDCARSGYGLAAICERIGYEFQHHDALEDAKAAGAILLHASELRGLDIEGWLERIEQPIDPNCEAPSDGKQEGDPSGPLYGETIVFTGALSMPRREAAARALGVGISVRPALTKKITLLCVGDQDVARLGGHEKSSKHRKAEEAIAKGQNLRIIRETDFLRMTQVASGIS